jgi:type II secretory pathway component PulK
MRRPLPSSARRGRSGSAVLIALAAVFLATALGLLLQARSIGTARTARARLAQTRCRIAAAEAVRRAAAVLASDPTPRCDSAFDPWAAPHESEDPAGLRVATRTEDAGRRFSWNNLAATNGPREKIEELAADLMTFCGVYSPDAKIAALRDALDGDTAGAWETDARATPPYRAQNRLLRAPGELAAVPGWSAALFSPPDAAARRRFSAGTLADNAAVVPVADGEEPLRINVNTASGELLLATAGLARERAVEMLLAFRANEPIESLAAIFAARPDWAAEMEGLIDTSSTWFRIRARAECGEEGGRAAATAWVRRGDGGDVEIRQWIWEEE